MRGAGLLLVAALAWGPWQAPAAQGERCGDWPAWPHEEFPDVDFANRIVIDGAEMRWNGRPVSRERLRQSLESDGRRSRPPVTILFLAMDVDCALVREVRALVTATMPCDRGLCSELHDQPVPPGPPPTMEEIMGDLEAATNEGEGEAEPVARPSEPKF